MRIRKFTPKDRKAIEHIHYETGFLGRSMKKIQSEKKLWIKKIQPYFEKEPESIFVAEENNEIVGYVLGCATYMTRKKIFNEFLILIEY
jgi:predicted N-acetyltransferase YhbS